MHQWPLQVNGCEHEALCVQGSPIAPGPQVELEREQALVVQHCEVDLQLAPSSLQLDGGGDGGPLGLTPLG